MAGRPFHVDCGLRCERATELREVMAAPGVWDSPMVWDRPDAVMFACPEHGLVEWDQTRYAERHARPPQAVQGTLETVR